MLSLNLILKQVDKQSAGNMYISVYTYISIKNSQFLKSDSLITILDSSSKRLKQRKNFCCFFPGVYITQTNSSACFPN